ncbi:MAG: long-chain fatty acid--CoA ligase [Actinomycetia bacterium]|nr:long-chain fatty acid--CoA ligase [Actinomycetes bacterium]MCP3911482.1 long-chain fatty acid--CoA ligase [Actinomycetes bacterium]MCP4084782.1 long-chain fatty acid--CoA ligase [Actinomycetes bacterium]
MLTSDEIHARIGDRTITQAFLGTLAHHGDEVVLRWQEGDGWGEWTMANLADQVARVATGLAELGVGSGDRVILMMGNRPEFFVADLATLMLGATPVSIYNSSSEQQIRYLGSHSQGMMAIVEAAFLPRFQAARADLPSLGAVVTIDDPGSHGADTSPWSALVDHEPLDLQEAAQRAKPDDLATVIYTSGTTGDPKGVMVTHRNITWTAESMRTMLDEQLGIPNLVGKRYISYLPLAHIMERLLGYYWMLFMASEVTCCPDPTQIATFAGQVHPNLLVGVPRVWEKIYAGVNAVLAADPEKQGPFNEAVAAAIPIQEAKSFGTATQEQIETWEFLDSVAFKQVRELIGLDQVEMAITGAAPIPGEMLEWFRAIGIPLSEGYGLSETMAALTNTQIKVKPGTVGPAVPGVEMKLGDDGEVLCRGGMVFEGYLDAPDKTAEVLDPDGWFHTGDIGEIDDDGYLKIVDRKKEIIVTAGGKNLSPANLEAALKMVPLIGQACAIGDRRKFVSALVVLEPDAALGWAAAHGVSADDLDELAQNPELVAEIEAGVKDVMTAFNSAESVKKVKILGHEWLPDGDYLTPTSKLKRRNIVSGFAQEIEALYS